MLFLICQIFRSHISKMYIKFEKRKIIKTSSSNAQTFTFLLWPFIKIRPSKSIPLLLHSLHWLHITRIPKAHDLTPPELNIHSLYGHARQSLKPNLPPKAHVSNSRIHRYEQVRQQSRRPSHRIRPQAQLINHATLGD